MPRRPSGVPLFLCLPDPAPRTPATRGQANKREKHPPPACLTHHHGHTARHPSGQSPSKLPPTPRRARATEAPSLAHSTIIAHQQSTSSCCCGRRPRPHGKRRLARSITPSMARPLNHQWPCTSVPTPHLALVDDEDLVHVGAWLHQVTQLPVLDGGGPVCEGGGGRGRACMHASSGGGGSVGRQGSGREGLRTC